MTNMKVRYPVDPKHRISSKYGQRKDPITGKIKRHFGYDFATPRGTPVYAVEDGVVFKAGYQNSSKPHIGFGLRVWQRLWIAGKPYDIFYAHLSKILVEHGDPLDKGQLIGYTGNTGKSSGPHLHFEIRPQGKKGIPLEFIKESKESPKPTFNFFEFILKLFRR